MILKWEKCVKTWVDYFNSQPQRSPPLKRFVQIELDSVCQRISCRLFAFHRRNIIICMSKKQQNIITLTFKVYFRGDCLRHFITIWQFLRLWSAHFHFFVLQPRRERNAVSKTAVKELSAAWVFSLQRTQKIFPGMQARKIRCKF